MIEAVCNLINSICGFLSKFIPSPSFLGDIAAFYIAIFALAVPISVDIITRISERYQSEVIVKRFLQEREIKQLPLFLMFNIILVIVLKFLIKDSPSSIMWKIFAWIMFVGFIHIVYLLFYFIRKIKKYLSSIKFILEELFVSAQNFFECKDINKGQLNFVESLEGAGDILVFATKQINKNKMVVQELKSIKDIIKKFFEIQKNNPKRFEQMIYAQKFLQLYNEDPKEASLKLAFNPDEYLITFSTAVNQFVRIYRAAIEIKNEDISRSATYKLNRLLEDIVSIPNNELFVEYLLELLSETTITAVERQDSSMYAASIHWYISIVFNKLRQKRGKFDLSYLKLFDKYFFSSIRFIVSRSQTAFFKNLVFSLVDGILIPSYNKGRISGYGYLIFETDFAKHNQLNEKNNPNKMIKNLLDCENDLDSKEKLDKWLEKFEELKNILEPYFSKGQLQKAKKIEEDIKDYVEMQFKYNNLLEIIFAIGAYCLLKQKPEYIKLLWDSKQPSDSDANWVGHDIFPKTLPEIIYFYFKEELFERKFDF
ncbi:MAG: hypothetical protein HYU63_02745, partial [Armatimonadetes bacterium]|nr:hypothetical protein [Armatimonadota bacterium]